MIELINRLKTGKNSAQKAPTHSDVCTRTREDESEKTLERKLVEGVRKRGGMSVKLTSQFHKGLPDRLVLLPHHTVCFVELKSTGETRTKLQELVGSQLEGLSFRVFVIDSSELLCDFFRRMDHRQYKIRKREEGIDEV